MNKELLYKHLENYLSRVNLDNDFNDLKERLEREEYYKSYTSDKIVSMNEEEFYEYTIDIKNEGNLDAQISEINQEIKSTKNILVAKINYDDGTEIKKGDVLKSGDKKTVKVSITYPKQKEKIYDELTLELSFSLKYVPVS